MQTPVRTILAAAIVATSCSQAHAVNLQFDYQYDTNGFFGAAGSVQRNILESAGAFFESVLSDTLTAISPDDDNQFNAEFSHPGTGSLQTVLNLHVPQDTLIVYAGGRALSGTTLGQGGPGGFDIPTAQSQAFVDNASSRGQAGALGPQAALTDFGPWGGAVTFDNDGTSWYYDPDLSTDGDVQDSDFFSVALHELGHLLGIGTSFSWENDISGSDFTGAASVGVFGGNVPLSGGDHWANGTQGNNGTQEAAMTPIILNGTRKRFTDLDLAGLTDIGWEVTPVPVPAAFWFLASSVFGLITASRKRA